MILSDVRYVLQLNFADDPFRCETRPHQTSSVIVELRLYNTGAETERLTEYQHAF